MQKNSECLEFCPTAQLKNVVKAGIKIGILFRLLVYKFTSSSCNATYIGKTKRHCTLLLEHDNLNTSDDEDIGEPFRKKRSLSAEQVPTFVSGDRYGHWPLQLAGNTQRCKASKCKRKTRFFCSKCQVSLCVVGSTCFTDFQYCDRTKVIEYN